VRIGDRHRPSERLVQFATVRQSGIKGHRGVVKPNHQTTNGIEPQRGSGDLPAKLTISFGQILDNPLIAIVKSAHSCETSSHLFGDVG
jgi:hypothetical protein